MRYLFRTVEDFGREKIVLITGPRQVGKTTLAKEWLAGRGLYLNWDVAEDREKILRRRYLQDPHERLVLDEIHKHPRWKGYLKGLADREGGRIQVVVTGSARLDIYQRGVDSLLGRHELLRLHPFTIGELTHGALPPPPEDWLRPGAARPEPGIWDRLERRSGFPEPYTKDDPLQHRRWSTRRKSLLIRDDLRELSQIRTLALVEHLAILLPGRVGSLLSVNAIREEIGVAHDTFTGWLEALERLYFCFRIQPYHRRIERSLRKAEKLYLWDWSQVEEPSARFENMMASHLLKAVHGWSDLGYGEYELKYWKDKDGGEVDFLITERGRPLVLFEAKSGDTRPSRSLIQLAERLGRLPHIQLLRTFEGEIRKGGGLLMQADRYLSSFP